MSVRVDVVNRTLIPICLTETSWGMRWPITRPGSEALMECPRNFVGRPVSRECSMKDATTPTWLLPDFSACLYEPFVFPYTKVRILGDLIIKSSVFKSICILLTYRYNCCIVSKPDLRISKYNGIGDNSCLLGYFKRATVASVPR